MMGVRRAHGHRLRALDDRLGHEVRPDLDAGDQRSLRHDLPVEGAEHGDRSRGGRCAPAPWPARAARRRSRPAGRHGSRMVRAAPRRARPRHRRDAAPQRPRGGPRPRPPASVTSPGSRPVPAHGPRASTVSGRQPSEVICAEDAALGPRLSRHAAGRASGPHPPGRCRASDRGGYGPISRGSGERRLHRSTDVDDGHGRPIRGVGVDVGIDLAGHRWRAPRPPRWPPPSHPSRAAPPRPPWPDRRPHRPR